MVVGTERGDSAPCSRPFLEKSVLYCSGGDICLCLCAWGGGPCDDDARHGRSHRVLNGCPLLLQGLPRPGGERGSPAASQRPHPHHRRQWSHQGLASSVAHPGGTGTDGEV